MTESGCADQILFRTKKSKLLPVGCRDVGESSRRASFLASISGMSGISAAKASSSFDALLAITAADRRDLMACACCNRYIATPALGLPLGAFFMHQRLPSWWRLLSPTSRQPTGRSLLFLVLKRTVFALISTPTFSHV